MDGCKLYSGYLRREALPEWRRSHVTRLLYSNNSRQSYHADVICFFPPSMIHHAVVHSESNTMTASAESTMKPNHGSPQNEQPIAAYRREFRSSWGEIIHYVQYRGSGNPPPDIGRPGDMYIDMSSGAHRLFIYDEEWQEWRGVYRSASLLTGGASFLVQHPRDKARTIWCSPTDIAWNTKNSFYKSRMRLFAQNAYTGSSFVPAHDLLSKSAILSCQSVPVKQIGEKPRQCEQVNLTSDGETPTPGHQSTELELVSGPDPDTIVLDATSKSTHSDIQSKTQPKASTSSQPLGTNSYKVFSTHEGSFESPYSRMPINTVTYSQYRGLGTPSVDLGSQGDLFVDKSPDAHRVFVRYENWVEWPGIYNTAGLGEDPLDGKFLHPEDPTRVVWCTDSDVTWLKTTLIRHWKVQHFAGVPPNTPFISSHYLISKLTVRTQSRFKRTLSIAGNSGGDSKMKKRKISGERPSSEQYVPDSEPHSPAEPQTTIMSVLPPSAGASHTGSSPETLLNTSNASARLSQPRRPSTGTDVDAPELEFSESSAQLVQSSLQKPATLATSSGLTPPPTPTLPSTTGATASVQKNETAEEMLPANLIEAAEEAAQAQRLKELHLKRKGRYQSRRQELVQNESDIAAQEEQLLEVEKEAKERLEIAQQNALKRREENRRWEEELRKEKEELAAREEKVFQREQAIKRRKRLVAQMENMIKRMDEP